MEEIVSQDDFAARAAQACRDLLGETADDVVFPAGRSRRSVRVRLPGRTVIATARRNAARAAHEVHILRVLGAADAPVPAVLAWADGWLIQQDLGGERLTAHLAGTDGSAIAGALDRALDGLARCHAAARQAGLGDGRAVIGASARWRADLATMPQRLAAASGIAPPALDMQKLADRVAPPALGFVKWDARPGNAAIRDDGSVGWFDWEHAGTRAPLDDLVWLFGDEYLGDRPTLEAAALTQWLGEFDGGVDAGEARDYLMTMLCLHACVRLALIVSYRRRDGRWWNRSRALHSDRVGVDRDCALSLCARGRRWSGETATLRPLAGWYADIAGWIAAFD